MPDIILDGKTRVAYVTTIASRTAPTVAELNAGTLLHDYPDRRRAARVPAGNPASGHLGAVVDVQHEGPRAAPTTPAPG